MKTGLVSYIGLMLGKLHQIGEINMAKTICTTGSSQSIS
jgi:hypothetical protein